MFTGVPTKPATTWHGERVNGVRRAACVIPTLNAEITLLDVNRCGALIEASAPLRVGSNHVTHFTFEGVDYVLPVRAVHSTSRFRVGEPTRYRIGLTFRTSTSAEWHTLDRLVAQLSSAGPVDSASNAAVA